MTTTLGKLILLVGPSGAGKSTHVKNYIYEMERQGGTKLWTKLGAYEVISSDEIRTTLCGWHGDQSKNKQVFKALHEIVKARICNGLLTVVDATNLNKKDRLSITKLFENDIEIEYHVIDRPLEEKLRDGGWRLNVDIRGRNLIEVHHEKFQQNLPDILTGDDDPRVRVIDLRKEQI